MFLPEACWMAVLCQLSVRDVCMAGRVNRWVWVWVWVWVWAWVGHRHRLSCACRVDCLTGGV